MSRFDFSYIYYENQGYILNADERFQAFWREHFLTSVKEGATKGDENFLWFDENVELEYKYEFKKDFMISPTQIFVRQME